MTGCASCCSGTVSSWGSWRLKKQDLQKHCYHSASTCVKIKTKRVSLLSHEITSPFRHWASVSFPLCTSVQAFGHWRTSAIPISVEEEAGSQEDSSNDSDLASEGLSEESVSKMLDEDQLDMLLADSLRQDLMKKLSEANQHNRYLKRQLQVKEDALIKCTNDLAVMELELQALIGLAEEIANSRVDPGSRQINGRYIQSHLLFRLQEFHEKLKVQIKDVGNVKFKDVALSWYGMAENVQVMGSFDGWSQGEAMSPEYTGDLNRFSTELKLRPGRYEIKFLVDGEWQLSPEYPTTGEGSMENNLLIVE